MPRRYTDGVPAFSFTGERVFFWMLPIVVALATACGEAAPAVSDGSAGVVVDDAGRRLAVTPARERIVSLVPSATDLLVALGVTERLVARTSHDTHPSLAHLPSLGRTLAPSAEAIIALRPDLVIVAPDYLTNGLAERLANVGLDVYEADAQRLDAVLATMVRLGALAGAGARADSLRDAIARGLDALTTETAAGARPSVVYAVWHAPAQVAGAGTYVDDLLRAAGARNAFADVEGWPVVSAEALVLRDPDIIVAAGGRHQSLRAEWLRATPGWRELRAVRADRLIVVDADLFNRPGPHILEAAHTLALALRRVDAP